MISKEILKNLQYFPEDIRLMYLHLWAVGMRISEVCTIKAKEYYRQDDDYWMQIYRRNEELQTDSYTGSVIQADAGI